MTAEFHWDDARIFLAIARAGTLSGAADKMNMGIATVSRRLDRLEQALNVPLFSRHQSGYRLTDDGEALLARAEALEYAGLAFGEAAQLQGHVAGVVRLATSDNLATHFILPSLKGLLDHYPELRVEVLSGVQPVNLHRRDADLAIRMVKPEAGHLTLKAAGDGGVWRLWRRRLSGRRGRPVAERGGLCGVAGNSPAPAGRPMDHAHPARPAV